MKRVMISLPDDLAAALEREARSRGSSLSTTAREATRPDGAEIVLTVDRGGTYRYDLVKDGAVLATEFERYPWCARPKAEFVAMLEEAGLAVEAVLKPHSDGRATDADESIVYVCKPR